MKKFWIKKYEETQLEEKKECNVRRSETFEMIEWLNNGGEKFLKFEKNPVCNIKRSETIEMIDWLNSGGDKLTDIINFNEALKIVNENDENNQDKSNKNNKNLNKMFNVNEYDLKKEIDINNMFLENVLIKIENLSELIKHYISSRNIKNRIEIIGQKILENKKFIDELLVFVGNKDVSRNFDDVIEYKMEMGAPNIFKSYFKLIKTTGDGMYFFLNSLRILVN